MNNKIKRNILSYLSSKNLFNVELYQRLIDDDVDINQKDTYGSFNGDTYFNVLVGSLLNITIVELLIKNNIDLNDDDIQKACFRRLLDTFKFFPKKRKLVLKIFTILFNNGMKIIDEKLFVKNVSNLVLRNDDIDIVLDFIYPLKNYFSESFIISFFMESRDLEDAKKLLNLGLYPTLYNFLKLCYKERLKYVLADYIAKHPYLDASEKYNL